MSNINGNQNASAPIAHIEPLREEYRQEQAAVSEWDRRVLEWQETVFIPLDRELVTSALVWDELTNSLITHWDELDGVNSIIPKLTAVAASVRRLEEIRQAATRWVAAGRTGQFGVPIAILDWADVPGPLTTRFQRVKEAPGRPHRSFLVSARMVDLGLTTAGDDLRTRLVELLGLPLRLEVAKWLPFLRDVLLPLRSNESLSNVLENGFPVKLKPEGVNAIHLPTPSEALDQEMIRSTVKCGLWSVFGVEHNQFDFVMNGLCDRLKGSSHFPSPTRQELEEVTTGIDEKIDVLEPQTLATPALTLPNTEEIR